MLSRLFIAALWSPAGKGLTSWLLFLMFSCVFVTFPRGILGQVWYLIVSILDLCRLSYLDIVLSNLYYRKLPPSYVNTAYKSDFMLKVIKLYALILIVILIFSRLCQ